MTTQHNQSRKYKLALISLLLVTGGWAILSILPGLAPMFSEFITGITGILMLYCTGNISNKFVVGRHIVEQAKATNTTTKSTGESHGA